jgi:hypothetical protein
MPPMPGVHPDYAAPIVRNASGGARNLQRLLGNASPQNIQFDAAKKRAGKLEANRPHTVRIWHGRISDAQ